MPGCDQSGVISPSQQGVDAGRWRVVQTKNEICIETERMNPIDKLDILKKMLMYFEDADIRFDSFDTKILGKYRYVVRYQ